MQEKSTGHAWQFFRAGGVEQVAIRTGADIAHIASLDQKLWVALACPTRGIEFDPETLDLIDKDHDGRIRAPELIEACQWAVAHVRDPDVLTRGSDALELADINTATEEGAALHAEAQRVLRLLGREGDKQVTLADVRERLSMLNALPFNGDGLLNPANLPVDESLRTLVTRIMELYGSQTGCDGQPGMGQAQLDAFFADVRAIEQWHAQAAQHSCVLPHQEQVIAAAQALSAVQEKVEDFFARTRLAAFDAKALTALNPSEEGYAALAAQQLTSTSEGIAALPLAPVVAQGVLPLTQGVNPAWAAQLQTLRTAAVTPVLGAGFDSLTVEQWDMLKAQLAPCQQWLAAYPQSPLGDMSLQDARQLLESGAEAQLQHWIAHDIEEKTHSAVAVELEKLIRLQRDLLRLLNNFVSFADFYSRRAAAFQAGTLYLDGRSCDLTVDVADPAAHATLAGLAKVYLAYCECRSGADKRHIVAAFTAGDVDYLMVGRNGVFYDREGRDWDATITKIIENPTSIGQAFFSPYKKFVRMVEEQIAKRAAAKQDSVTAGMGTTASKLVDMAKAPVAPAPAVVAGKKTDVGTVAAIGVALGSISTVMVGIFGKFVELGPWIPVALLGIILAISGPSMMIAWLKLRQRSLGPILDASGWAINGRMNINLKLGRALSQVAKVPASAKLGMQDPYADAHGMRWVTVGALVVAIALGLAWRMQWLDTVLPEDWRYGAVRQAVQAAMPAVEQAVHAASGE